MTLSEAIVWKEIKRPFSWSSSMPAAIFYLPSMTVLISLLSARPPLFIAD